MKYRLAYVVCCALFAGSYTCHAANEGEPANANAGEPYFFYMISCGSYIEHRTSQRSAETRAADMYYVTGWLSAYNRFHSGDDDITQDTDIGSVMLWLENYCRENPLGNMEAGLVKLTGDLHAKNASRPVTAPPQTAHPPPAVVPAPATGN